MRVLSIYIAVLLSVTVTGCSDDFIAIDPESSISADQYFSNQEEATLAVNGAYAPLQNLASNHWWVLGELRSDNTTYQYNEEDRRNVPLEQVDEFLLQTNNPYTEGFWSASYVGISRCNVFLNRVDDVPFADESLRSRLTGEILFLRSLYYYQLTRFFGPVPLVFDEVTAPDNNDQYILGRTPLEDIYTRLIEDLQTAASKMNEGSYSTADAGRAKPGAAYALLGEIQMMQANYQEAIAAFIDVEKLGYALLDNYADVFNPNNKNHSESIFEVQYFESNQGKGSNFIYRFAPFNSGQDIVGDNQFIPYNAGFNIPTKDLLVAYEPGDLRKDASIGWYVKEGNSAFDVAVGDSIPYVRKYHHGHTVPGVTGDNFPVFRYARVLLLRAEALNELGQTAEANSLLTVVRRRAGLEARQAGASKDAFKDAVHHELQVELAFENHRWLDIQRRTDGLTLMKAHGERRKAGNSRLSNAYQITEHRMRYPLPAREIKLNTNLDQNEGW
ncbi:MAG: RagB/SusD family nutrient uptake outer membrane protein [Sphingobacteriaceae bacterium]